MIARLAARRLARQEAEAEQRIRRSIENLPPDTTDFYLHGGCVARLTPLRLNTILADYGMGPARQEVWRDV